MCCPIFVVPCMKLFMCVTQCIYYIMTSIHLVLNPDVDSQPFNLGFETSIHVCDACSIEGTHSTNTPIMYG